MNFYLLNDKLVLCINNVLFAAAMPMLFFSVYHVLGHWLHIYWRRAIGENVMPLIDK